MGGVLGDRLHLDARGVRQHTEVFKETLLDLLQVFVGVLVGHVGWADVQFEVRPKVLKVIIVGQLVGDGAVQGYCGFVGPAACHVADGVASTTKHQQGQVETFDVLDTFGVTLKNTHTHTLSSLKKRKTLSIVVESEMWFYL